MNIKMQFYYLINCACLFGFCVFQVEGSTLDTIKKCCDLGTEGANKNAECVTADNFSDIPKSEADICRNSWDVCCKAQLKEIECKLGIDDAKNDNCNAKGGTERKYCCDACKFGKMAGSSGESCSNKVKLGNNYDQYFKSCCEEFSNLKSTSKSSNKVTTVSTNDPLPVIENLCDIDGLCAQICIPTADSYKCDCHPGFTLMADGLSCKDIKQKSSSPKRNNRCQINNPCDHNCIDTGVAIICTCKDGFQLASDKRTCKDIDECSLGIHSCLKNEVCINGEGYYDCELIDSDEDAANYDLECPIGYKFNGEQDLCDDIDECKIPLICNHSQKCVNTIGSFYCTGEYLVCPPGFYFRGSTQDCEDIDECLTGKDDCNRDSQVCLNTKGNYTCIEKASRKSCPPGFKMNTIFENCEDINECLENLELCADTEECINEPGGHRCILKTDITNNKPYLGNLTTNTTPKSVTLPAVKSTTTVKGTTSTTTVKTTTKAATKTTEKITTKLTTKSSSPEPVFSAFTTKVSPNKNFFNYDKYTTPRTTPITIRYTYPTTIKPDPVYSTFKTKVTPSRNFYNYNKYTTPHTPVTIISSTTVKPITCPRGFVYQNNIKQCIDINECLEGTHYCDNYQDCYNTQGSYLCNCRTGFTKNSATGACEDINECQVGSNDCSDGQRCDNTIGSYLCSRVAGCGTGYTLNYASGLCEDDDECLLGTHTCDKLGTNLMCRNTYGSYRCEKISRWQPSIVFVNLHSSSNNYTRNRGQTKRCLPGYYMDLSGSCQDINECESNPCTRGQKCVNLKGKYECVSKFECKGGFEINEAGDACVDINECTRGKHACSSTQICKNHIGYHVCLCPPGHKLVNNECVDINECEYYKDRICSTNSYCVNTIGSYKCICKEGFREQGNKCIDIDECSEIPSLCHQRCVNVWGSYRCSCERGFLLQADNRSCLDVNECEKFSDKHLCIGTCENVPGSYVCRCPPGYKLGSDGRTCQDIDECQTQQPCRGRDTICFNTRGGYECPSIVCPINYIRDQDHKSRCKRDPMKCNFLGSCSDTPEQYTYHFFNLISNLPMPNGPIKFFQMKGPAYESSSTKFNLKLENVHCPQNVEASNINFFKVNRELRKADISFLRPIEGPQQIELSFEMQLFTNNLFTGKVVAKIFIYVSKHSF